MRVTTGLVNYLALQASQISDSGLFHGRMGIILSLYCHGVIHDNQSLCDYASDILQNTADDYFDGDISIENGLSGLGLGFTLLYKAGMFKDNLNDILYEIDKKIMSVDSRRMEDHSFRKGALGVLFYIRTRLSVNQECVSIHKDYIKELEANVKSKSDACKTIREERFLESLRQPAWEMEDYLDKDAGIDNGSAYYLIINSYDKVFSCK